MINDEMLIDVAKLLNGESATLISHLGFGATTVTVSPTMTDIPDEYLPRSSVTKSRDVSPGNVFTATGLKTGASITNPTGIYVNSTALFNASTSGIPRAVVVLPNLLHTTNFDIEETWTFTIGRQ